MILWHITHGIWHTLSRTAIHSSFRVRNRIPPGSGIFCESLVADTILLRTDAFKVALGTVVEDVSINHTITLFTQQFTRMTILTAENRRLTVNSCEQL
jgi:hypothetical protein